MKKVLSTPPPIDSPYYKHQLSVNCIIGIQSHYTKEKAFFRKLKDKRYTDDDCWELIPTKYITTSQRWFLAYDISMKEIRDSDNNFLKPFDFYVFDSQAELLKWLAV